jgi:hypothetical protein
MSASDARRLVLVAGAGRSGTSLLSGILGQLGLHIPKPEVQANATNPRGFGEPRWVVDFHWRLLRARRVEVNDARPSAFSAMADTADNEEIRSELRDWLYRELDENAALVVKDPRTAWFLPLWLRTARELGVQPDFVTMLRHPAETVTSATKSYGEYLPAAARAGAWANVSLETERATRGARRAFVRYEDLLADWRREIARVGERLELPQLSTPDPGRAAGVDAFVDPTLHRNRLDWDDLDPPVPPRVREVVDAAWVRLQELAGPDGDAPAALAALDETRAAYGRLYADAEALVHSSIRARRARPVPPPTTYLKIARRVPAPVRKGLRRLLRVS